MKRSERWVLILALLIGLGILGVALFGDQGLHEVRRLQSEREALLAEIQNLRARRDDLRRQVVGLKENPRAIEERARSDLGMIKEGETVFLLPDRDGR